MKHTHPKLTNRMKRVKPIKPIRRKDNPMPKSKRIPKSRSRPEVPAPFQHPDPLTGSTLKKKKLPVPKGKASERGE